MQLKKNITPGKSSIAFFIFFIFQLFIFIIYSQKVYANEKFVELIILDKVSSKTSNIEMKVGEELINRLYNYLTSFLEDLDKNLVEREEKIQRELILSSGKPSNIIDKILEGKMKKFYSEVTLLNQFYILDQDKLVKTVIEEHSKYEFKLKSFEIISL